MGTIDKRESQHPQGKNALPSGSESKAAQKLVSVAHLAVQDVLQQQKSQLEGLTESEVSARLEQYGYNEVVKEKQLGLVLRLLGMLKDPLTILLIVLAIISIITHDIRAAVVILTMVVLGVTLRFVQESRADSAAEKLKEMVSTMATVIRAGQAKSIPLRELVPGDIISLSAGDMVPADVRVLVAKDLFVNQSALTGESIPVEKWEVPADPGITNALELPNICFLGSNVESGTGSALVIHTGKDTYFGSLASSITGERQNTSFDQGINKFTWLMLRFMMIMVPAVFLINGLSKHDWLQALLFAVAVAVGMTPEMLPMIVTTNLSQGALAMSKKKVIIKRLNSIQNFGAMDVLCTDKTGTITQGKIVLEKHIDPRGNPSEKVLEFGYINSYFQTGLKNLMDEAILQHDEHRDEIHRKWKKIDEIPFDFNRRRMSVIVEDENGLNMLVCKGAVEEVMGLCSHVEADSQVLEVLPEHTEHRKKRVADLNADGFRVVAVAYKLMPGAPDEPVYTVNDESDMVLAGFLAFLDPPKETAMEAIEKLHQLKVEVKILTGDNDVVTRRICGQVNLPVEHIVLGSELDAMTPDQFSKTVEENAVFAKLSPAHKELIIAALRQNEHVVGFMGDGINDAPALKAADVGISVDSAVDIAKESSDIILLENNLLILQQGVIEGRKVFGNIMKYIKMAASSNFGNMFSVVGASAFLPFLPMLPIQVLVNNLLYDFSQTTIPTDEVDQEWLVKPRKWGIQGLERFILLIGPISSIFDYLTFALMLFVFHSKDNPALFHTGWFVESLFTQTLIIHVIRTNKIPFIQSRASTPLMISSLLIVSIGAFLPFSPLASTLGFVPLPAAYWGYLAGMLVCYVALTQLAKTWFIRKFGE
ncbi:MAG TPA: magnesium-translocating P-type ATPase [Anaerolineaceae bacterium]|nr:magnesium-translocating P-type ATPase [Anaerolineaceae bacterium]